MKPVSPKARVIPKNKRHEFPSEAFETRNTKVRVSIYLDLDVLNFLRILQRNLAHCPIKPKSMRSCERLWKHLQVRMPRLPCARRKALSHYQRMGTLSNRRNRTRNNVPAVVAELPGSSGIDRRIDNAPLELAQPGHIDIRDKSGLIP